MCARQRHVLLSMTILMPMIATVHPAPIQITQALEYLSKYGYLPSSGRNLTSSALLDANAWQKGLKDFQRFAGVKPTGKLDEETVKLMSLPRCGVEDKPRSKDDARSKRYALQGSRWLVKNLTYKIKKYSKRLSRAEVDHEITRAFAVWSEYTDLSFKHKKSGPVDIEIMFVEGDHGDGDPFDGNGPTIAHAFFPEFGSDAHFDDAELWTIDEYYGTNLFFTAAHEFGHSLGLSHSDVPSALMSPFYRGYQPDFKLHSDDILAIQALYGKKSSNRSNGTSDDFPRTDLDPSPSPRDDYLCEDPKIDTIFSTENGRIYVFKGTRYYELNENLVVDGSSELISDGWPGLPDNIDAAFTYKDGKTYFFKDDLYYRFNGRQLEHSFPRKLPTNFVGVADYLDAVSNVGDNKIAFYKGRLLTIYDPRFNNERSYNISLINVPGNLDAAFTHANGSMYFFKDDKYYHTPDLRRSISNGKPLVAGSTANLFGCEYTFETVNNNFWILDGFLNYFKPL